MNNLDLRISELIVSRFCHELVGAAGAVGNGIEYLEDTKDEPIDVDVLSLLSNSSAQLTTRLKFYRVAYGFTGNSIDNIAELRSLSLKFFDVDPDISLRWQMAPIAPELALGEGRLILNMIVLARHAIALKGEIEVEVDDDSYSVTVTSDQLMRNETFDQLQAGAKSTEDLTARNIHEYLTLKLAENLNITISQEEITENDRVKICYSAKKQLDG